MKVALGIVVYENKILLIKRKKREGDLLWAFPGGKFDENLDNSIQDTVVREVKEETGVNVVVKNLIAKKETEQTTLFYFECDFISQSSKYSTDEVLEVSFYSYEKMLKLVTTQIYPPVLEFIKNRI